MRTQNLAIVFTDVKGFAEAASRASLEQNQALLEKLHALLEPVFEAFHGRIVKSVSDAYLVAFESPTLAVLAAQAAQDELWKHNGSAPAHTRLALRTAVSAGEVTVEGGDVLGEPVAAASSVRDATEPGDVTMTEAAWLVVSRADVKAELVGQHGEQGVFRVPRAAEGPPFGGQLMQKAPPVPTGEVGSPLTGSKLKAVRSPRAVKRLLAVVAALVAVAAVVAVVKLVSGPPPLESAIDAVKQAGAAERSQKVVAAQALIAQERRP
ncbi:MAG: adenylate/guanylate cyclase domain-containing protein, partial [Myxococcaceae bacterium]|nr:adenylate/guanylate cyclase domain-containing protein [Myxococcaceae bacterium]